MVSTLQIGHRLRVMLGMLILLALPSGAQAQEAYYISHKPSGLKVNSCDSADGSVVTVSDSLSDCAYWHRVDRGNYFHIENSKSQKYMRPDTSDNGSPIVIQPNNWRGNWTQWSYDERGDGFGHLVNRATGKYIYVSGISSGESLELQPSSWRGDYTRWAFEPVVFSTPEPTPTPLVTQTPIATPTPVPTQTPEPPVADEVSLRASSIVWQTFDYAMSSDFSLSNYDHSRIVERAFSTWIIENDFLKVTLVPEFGGRILSMVNKTTGREELYQNPVGTPYLVGSGIFYYDWLMIYGGIFPTLPEAEHGKTWNREWSLDVITETSNEVTVVMSYVDNGSYDRAPSRYMRGETGIVAEYYVTLKAGRAALDTEIVLTNPTDQSFNYEYWTNTTLSPGSEVGDSKATSGLEMIAPIDSVSIDYGIGVSAWEDVKWFSNHTNEGIAYASPNMQGANFWGAINHDNEEGIFRIADNTLTPGLKIWTFGYDSVFVDPFSDGTEWHRPAIELWAGRTNRFFQKTNFPANSTFAVKETYSPSIGLENVTHANTKVLANLAADGVHLNFMEPGSQYRVIISEDNQPRYYELVTPDPLRGNHFSTGFGAAINLIIENEQGEQIFSASN